jgi:hypothetical protein
MMFRAGIVLLPLVAFAQTAPPEVDQALRARATEFLQYHVEGNFRKAFELVAEDSKDFYFASQKTKYNWFKIDEIKYSDDFTKANVKIIAEYNVSIQAHILPVTNSAILQWQIEDGKWVWHYDPKSVMDTPMGWSDRNAAKANAERAAAAPKLTDEALAQRAHDILTQSGVDKSDVTLASDKMSSDQVVFHNSLPGPVRIALDPFGKLPGFRAELDKEDIGASGNAVLKFTYDPAADSSRQAPGTVLHLQLRIEPFDRIFPVDVRFSGTKQDPDRQP